MRTYAIARLVTFAAGSALLASMTGGCIFIASDETKAAPRPTVGRQLVDLKNARDSGAIDDKEYQHTKAKLLSDCK